MSLVNKKVLARLKELKELAIDTYPILRQMKLVREKGDKSIPTSLFRSFEAILQTEDKIITVWTFRAIFCYHFKLSMIFKGTINIEWNGLGQPWFQWFFDNFGVRQPFGFGGFRWLSTLVVQRWND